MAPKNHYQPKYNLLIFSFIHSVILSLIHSSIHLFFYCTILYLFHPIHYKAVKISGSQRKHMWVLFSFIHHSLVHSLTRYHPNTTTTPATTTILSNYHDTKQPNLNHQKIQKIQISRSNRSHTGILFLSFIYPPFINLFIHHNSSTLKPHHHTHQTTTPTRK